MHSIISLWEICEEFQETADYISHKLFIIHLINAIEALHFVLFVNLMNNKECL